MKLALNTQQMIELESFWQSMDYYHYCKEPLDSALLIVA